MKDAPACPGCEGERTQSFLVDGLDCATEVALIEGRFRGMPGVCSVRASAMSGQAILVHTLAPGEVERAFAEAGFRVREARTAEPRQVPLRGPVTAALLTVAGFLAGFTSQPLSVAFYAPAILIGGLPVVRRALHRARAGALDMNVLMTVAVLGAMAIGEWGEGATTVVLFSLAQLLEARSLERARRALTGLLAAPELALARRAGAESRVPASSVSRGETILVGPGERFPLDGVVEAGTSEVDQSSLTGESTPVVRGRGDEVFAGSINGAGALEVRVTRPASETMLARVLRRVEEAQASKAPSQDFVERFARVYTPVVVAIAVMVAVAPPLLGLGTFAQWTYRALVLLVISCPCALVISTPVSVVSALTAASRRGILVKGGAHLEDIGRVKAVIFDKTGTLTRGQPVVTDVVPAPGRSERDVLGLAAAVEARSGHPLGAAVVSAARHHGLDVVAAEDAAALPGRGVRGKVNGRRVLVGSHRLFDEKSLCDHRLDGELRRLEEEGKTAVLVGLEDEPAGLVGVLAVADAVRPEAAGCVAELHRDGLTVAMLTGDNRRTADAIADALGIEERRADLLPEDKVARVQELQKRHGFVAMVGDGVNDAPALAAASVGVAMGRRGADAALETADIALMSDDLRLIPEAIRLGRATRRVVRQNIALSLAVKGLVLGLAVMGLGSLWAAVAADMGASLLVIGNGLRLLGRPAMAAGGVAAAEG